MSYLAWLTNIALVHIWDQMREVAVRGLSQWVQLCTWSPNKLWRSNSIFNLCVSGIALKLNSTTPFPTPIQTIIMKCLPWWWREDRWPVWWWRGGQGLRRGCGRCPTLSGSYAAQRCPGRPLSATPRGFFRTKEDGAEDPVLRIRIGAFFTPWSGIRDG